MVHWGQYIWLTYLKPQPETAMLLLYLESVYTYRDDIVTKIPGNIEIGASKSDNRIEHNRRYDRVIAKTFILIMKRRNNVKKSFVTFQFSEIRIIFFSLNSLTLP